MSILVTIPHAKDPSGDPGAVSFARELESLMNLRGQANYFIYGNAPKTMLDLSTHEARGTSYNSELSTAMNVANFVIEIHDTNEEDFSSTNELFVNTIDNLAEASVIQVENKNHYAVTLAGLIFDIPSLVLFVNPDSIDLYPAVAEILVEFSDGESRKTDPDLFEESSEEI